jgi:hypothetical protein
MALVTGSQAFSPCIADGVTTIAATKFFQLSDVVMRGISATSDDGFQLVFFEEIDSLILLILLFDALVT